MSKEEKEEVTEAKTEPVATKSGVSEEKVRKIAVAGTVGGVLLIVFLLIVLIIQFVQIGVKRAAERELDDLIAEQSQSLEGEKDELDSLVRGNKMYWEALDYGYKKYDTK